MKKRLKLDVAVDITKRGRFIGRIIQDIRDVKHEAMRMKLHGEIKEIVLKVVRRFDNELTEIESMNNYKDEKILNKTFKKNELLQIESSLVKDIEMLCKYRDELVKVVNSVKDMKVNVITFKNYKVEIIGNNKAILVITDTQSYNIPFENLTELFKVLDEKIEIENYKEFKYTFRTRGCGPGAQPSGFLRWENSDEHRFEVIFYNRRLTADEISKYELIDLN